MRTEESDIVQNVHEESVFIFQKKYTLSLVLLCSLLIIGYYSYYLINNKDDSDQVTISSFKECVEAGNMVMESYPERCLTQEGVIFTHPEQQKDIDTFIQASTTQKSATRSRQKTQKDTLLDTPLRKSQPIIKKCFIGGCSSHLCTENEDMVSTCEYREEYGCYKKARCELQQDNTCGWTETPDFKACIDSIRSLEGELK